MLTAELNERDLAALRAHREYPAVSVILPTHRTFPDNKQDPILLRNLLDEASTRLRDASLPRGIADEVTGSLEAAAAESDLEHAAEALVLFAAPGGEHHTFSLPYVHPRSRVAIGQSFATRDLVAAQEHVWSYWTLVLSEQPTRLWSGTGERLAESHVAGFPMSRDARRLPLQRAGGHGGRAAPRSQGGSGGDRPPEETQLRHMFGAMASALADGRPLVVTGVPRYLAYFEQLAPAPVMSQFIGSAEGSFDHASGPELAAIVAPVLTAERQRWQAEAIGRLETARSERLFAGGLTQVWDLAAAGQIRELLAEEGYLAPARQDEGHLLPPGDPGGEQVDDAVDAIMDAVLDGGGEVIFVPDGSLESSHRIAASLRY
jgi:Bacterial archaeo-eukaryotic release factor family 3